MAYFPITTLTSLQIASPNATSPANISQTGAGGFGFAQVTEDQMNALTPKLVAGMVTSPFGLGATVFNITADELYTCTVAPTLSAEGKWVALGGGGGANVTYEASNVLVKGSIPIFSGENPTGLIITGSDGLTVADVIALPEHIEFQENLLRLNGVIDPEPNATVVQLSGLSYLQFHEAQGLGSVFIGGEVAQQYFINGDNITTVITNGLPVHGATSVGASLEINNSSGCLLLSGASNQEILFLPQPVSGMLMYNNTTLGISAYLGNDRSTISGGAWQSLLVGNPLLAGEYHNATITIGGQGQIEEIGSGVVVEGTVVGGTGINIKLVKDVPNTYQVNIKDVLGNPGTFDNPRLTVNATGQITSINNINGNNVTVNGAVTKFGVLTWNSSTDKVPYVVSNNNSVTIDLAGNITATGTSPGNGTITTNELILPLGYGSDEFVTIFASSLPGATSYPFILPPALPELSDQVLSIDPITGQTSWVPNGGGGGGDVKRLTSVNDSIVLNPSSGVGVVDLSVSPIEISTRNITLISGNENLEDNATGISIIAPTNLQNSYSLTLPNNMGINGQLLATDGVGTTSWIDDGTSTEKNSAIALFLNRTNIVGSYDNGTDGIGAILQQPFIEVLASTTNSINGFYLNGPNDDGIGATLSAPGIGLFPSIDDIDIPLLGVILVRFQNNNYENGVYKLTDRGGGGDGTFWQLTRTTDYDTPALVTSASNTVISVIGGMTYGGTTYTQTQTLNRIGQQPDEKGDIAFGINDKPLIIDGVTILPFQSVLLTGQVQQIQNGIFDFGFQARNKIAVQYATNAILSGDPTYNNGPNDDGIGAFLTGSGVLNVNFVDVVEGEVILVKNQANAIQNGFYTVVRQRNNQWILMRKSGYDTPASLTMFNPVVFYSLPDNKELPDKSFVEVRPVTRIGFDPINYLETKEILPYNFTRSTDYNEAKNINNSIVSIFMGNTFNGTYWNTISKIERIGTSLIKYNAMADLVSERSIGGNYYNGIAGVDATITQLKIIVDLLSSFSLSATYNNGLNDDGIGATLSAPGIINNIDRVTPVVGSIILVSENGHEFKANGIYQLTNVGTASTSWSMVRVSYYDTPTQITSTSNTMIYVQYGKLWGSTSWKESGLVVKIGADPIRYVNYTPFSMDGLSFGQSVLMVKQDDSVQNGIYIYNKNLINVIAASPSNILANYNNGPNNDGIEATLTLSTIGTFNSLDGAGFPNYTYLLIFNQSNEIENGVYLLTNTGSPNTNAILTRAINYNTPSQITSISNRQILVANGNTYSGKTFNQIKTITKIGTDNIEIVQAVTPSTYIFTRSSYYDNPINIVPNTFVGILGKNISLNTYWTETSVVNNVGIDPITFIETPISSFFSNITTENLIVNGTLYAIGGPIIFPTVQKNQTELFELANIINGSVYYSMSVDALRMRINNKWTTIANIQ